VSASSEWYVRASEAFTSHSGDMHTLDEAESVIELSIVGFVATLDRATTRRDLAIPSWDPFHILSDG